jgi:large subunit ribosomal protein L11
MSKIVKAKVKIQLFAGKANPGGIGKEMGPHGINLGKFCLDFNNLTKAKGDELCPALVIIYTDKTFDIILKTPPTSYLITKAAKIEKGSSTPGKNKDDKPAGKITSEQAMDIAKIKLVDCNTMSLESVYKSVLGTAKSMGIEVIGK